MFKSCSKIIEMDLSHFDTSQVTNMNSMFELCTLLTSLNLTNFNTSQVTDMSHMFESCKSLKYLDLSYFDTSQVKFMYEMFFYCQSLIVLNLSNFNTTQVYDFEMMFAKCSSLISLDLSNFKILIDIETNGYIFDNCSSLEYIDLENATIDDYYKYIFNIINENILLCSNDYKWNEIINGSNITINCNNNKEYQCFKKNLNKPYYKDICKKCGENYFQMYNDANNNNSYIYIATKKHRKVII